LIGGKLWEKLSKRDKKALIVCGVAVISFVTYVGVFSPLMAYKKKMRNEIEAKTLMLAKYRKFVKRKKTFETRLKEVESEYKEIQKQLLVGKTLSVAASDLQKMVEKLASSSGIEIKTQKMVPPEKNEYYTKVFVEIKTESSITELVNFMGKVEYHKVLAFPAKVVIKALEARDPKRVTATICIMGLTLSDKSPKVDT
jgi:Tfp pilus assembly protein PilO